MMRRKIWLPRDERKWSYFDLRSGWARAQGLTEQAPPSYDSPKGFAVSIEVEVPDDRPLQSFFYMRPDLLVAQTFPLC